MNGAERRYCGRVGKGQKKRQDCRFQGIRMRGLKATILSLWYVGFMMVRMRAASKVCRVGFSAGQGALVGVCW
jgi:hypothetical protein